MTKIDWTKNDRDQNDYDHQKTIKMYWCDQVQPSANLNNIMILFNM